MIQKLPIPMVLLFLLLAAYSQPLPADNPIRPTCKDIKYEGGLEQTYSIKWLSPTERHHASKLERWCSTVGPAYIVAPGAAVPTRDGRLLVVNWNVHVGNGDLEKLVHTLRETEKAAGHGEPELVLLLQEALRRGTDVPSAANSGSFIPGRIEGSSLDIAAVSKKLGLWMYYVPSMRNGGQPGDQAEDRGNAILSSLPLEDFHAIELPFAVQRRVALVATVRETQRTAKFRVAVTHLDTRAPLVKGFIFGAPAARNGQAKWLAESLATLQQDGLPLVLGGDLNTHWGPLESAVGILSKTAARIDCGKAPTHTTGLTLDYLFAQLPPGRVLSPCRRLNDRFNSDHHPLVMEMDD